MAIPTYNHAKGRSAQSVVDSLRCNGKFLYKTNIVISINGKEFTFEALETEKRVSPKHVKKKYKLLFEDGQYWLFEHNNGIWEKLCFEKSSEGIKSYIINNISKQKDIDYLLLAVETIEQRLYDQEKTKQKKAEERISQIRASKWEDKLYEFIHSPSVRNGVQNVAYFTENKRVVSPEYGLGTIKAIDDKKSRIMVDFDDCGKKTFVYPRCIENGNLLQIIKEPDDDWF